jgi:hypothetical protein
MNYVELLQQKATSAGKKKSYSLNTSMWSDAPNVYLVSENYKEPYTPRDLSHDVNSPDDEV